MRVEPNKDKLIAELKELDYQSLATALMYARYYLLYGEDVTKQWVSAVQQSEILEKAYRKGYYDAMERCNRMREFEADKEPRQTLKNCENCGYPYKLAGKCYSCDDYSQWVPIEADKEME